MRRKEKIFEYDEGNILKIKELWKSNGYRFSFNNVGIFSIVVDNFLTSSDPIKVSFVEYKSGKRGVSATYLEDGFPAEIDMDTIQLINKTLNQLDWNR